MNMDCRKLNEALNIGGADCIPDAVEGIDYVVLSGGSFFKEPWNKKEVIVFGKKYKSIKDACKYNNITYNQYKVLVDEDLSIDNGEDAAMCIAICLPNSNISSLDLEVSKLNKTPNFPTFFFNAAWMYEKFITLLLFI